MDKRRIPVEPHGYKGNSDDAITPEQFMEQLRNASLRYPNGIHAIWIAKHPSRFGKTRQPTSPNDRPADVGIPYREWYALFFEVLNARDVVIPNPAARSGLPIEFTGDVPGFPLLSRIRGRLHDAEYSPSEIAELRAECKRIEVHNNADASTAVSKLLTLCDLAETHLSGLYFIGD